MAPSGLDVSQATSPLNPATTLTIPASSLMAIGYAGTTLNKGKLNFILAGGMEAPVTPYALLCCNTYGMLSCDNEHPSGSYRPFDRDRSGFVIGEGAGIVVMEEEGHFKARNVHPRAWIAGYGTTCDGKDRINPDTDPAQLVRAIKMALADAGIGPDEIDYISLDGFAADIWDKTEVEAIKNVFGTRVKSIPASCPKSMFGNLLGASGAVDLIITVLAMEHGLVPPTVNLENPDPGGLDYVIGKARSHVIRKALIISRGRGGINSALVVEKA